MSPLLKKSRKGQTWGHQAQGAPKAVPKPLRSAWVSMHTKITIYAQLHVVYMCSPIYVWRQICTINN